VQARNRRIRLALLALVAVLAVGVPTVLGAIGALERAELATVDARLAVRGEDEPNPDVVVVGIDEKTIGEFGVGPILPRSVHARVLDRLKDAGADVVAYDLRFQGESVPRHDEALIDSVSRNRPVVLATFDGGGRVIPVPAGHDDPEAIGATLASIGVPTDDDGNVRKLLYRPIKLRTLPVESGELFLGEPVEGSAFDENEAWIDFAGPPRTYATHSLIDVLRGEVPDDAFDGKVVIVGPTDPAAKDLVQTPTADAPMPGPELQANATATVLDGFPLRDASGLANAALLLAMGLVAPLVAVRRSALLVILVAVGALAAFLLAAQLAYDAGRVLGVAEPVLGLLIGTAGALIVHYALVTRERRHLRNLFSRFVPPEVVNEVVDRVDDDLRIGGVRRDGTVMFSDLRGFTSFSETQEPELVVEVVNRYLSEMSDAIQAHGGTLVSFMGDGIMALFGAPIEQPDHATRAVDAAREMLGERLPRFNAWLAERGIDREFRMGIGLNSGPVMSGNVGSERRLEYTAIGDTTNTAARLEGMTKGTDHQAFLSESTHERLGDAPADIVEVGEVEVRGREARLRVWALSP
jgi:adenylate cyclase